LLLDTGSTPAVRATAAQQLGEIQKQHPGELHNLLSRVVIHLSNKEWDARIAAGQAIEAIAKNVPQWDPPETVKIETEISFKNESSDNKYSFENFDISNVLQNGKTLLGSAGKVRVNYPKNDNCVVFVVFMIFKRLGLGGEFMDVDLLDDVDISGTTTSQNTQVHKVESASIQPPRSPILPPEDMAGLSARERNKLKRKAKNDAKIKGKEKLRVVEIGTRRTSGDYVAPLATPLTPTTVKVEPDGSGSSEQTQAEGCFNFTPQPCSSKIVVESKKEGSSNVTDDQSNEWPFENVCESLCVALFNPCWEVRHGACIGLREILKVHGHGAGRRVGLTKTENEFRHNKWLEDVAIRLLCVFALDRFGDFVSDQVVAPVRETCSQTMGALLRYMSPQGVENVHRVLLQMIYQTDVQGDKPSIWEVRHAGMLGLKYAVAVRKDLVNTILDGTVGAVILGLKDSDDDVRAVAASILIPIAEHFVTLSAHKIPEIVTVLWDCLKDLKDDLTASTASVMDFLARLFSFPKVLEYMRTAAISDPSHSLTTLIPRLYPFFRHTITSVRSAVLNTLLTFLGMADVEEWVDHRAFRLVFQNMIVEEKKDVLDLSLQVWSALVSHVSKSGQENKIITFTAQYIRTWFMIIMTPLGTPIDRRLFFVPDGPVPMEISTNLRRRSQERIQTNDGDDVMAGHNIDTGMLQQDFALVSVDTVLRGRVTASKGLGMLMSHWPNESLEASFEEIIISCLSSTWASNKQLAAVIIEEWARSIVENEGYDIQTSLLSVSPLAVKLSNHMISMLESEPPKFYSELISILRRIRGECQALLNTFVSVGKIDSAVIPTLPSHVLGEVIQSDVSFPLFSIEIAVELSAATFNNLLAQVTGIDGKSTQARSDERQSLNDRKRRVMSSIGYYESTKHKNDVVVFAAIAGAVVALRALPPKLNPVVRSIMNSIKTEENLGLQQRSAATLASLVELCASEDGSTRVNPNDKIVKNLCTFLCSDPTTTPELQANRAKEGILSLQKAKEPDKGSSNNDSQNEDEELKSQKLIRRGAETALRQFSIQFGPKLFDIVPRLWTCVHSSLSTIFAHDDKEKTSVFKTNINLGQDVIDSLQILQTLVPVFHESLQLKVTELLPCIVKAIQCQYSVIRSMAARCFATIANVITIQSMQIIIDHIIPLLGDSQNVIRRQGAAELIYHVVQTMDAKILPYVIFLIVPILGRMSDVDENVRLVSTNCFAMLIKLVPLEAGIPDPPGLSTKLLIHRDEERKFLAQLLDSRKLDPYEIPVTIKAELRKYQQEGVNWLAFLNRYQLHGILCDDMGLGKTLQSICILASDHHMRATKNTETKSPDSVHCPSLVVCPPTLTGH
ncbi:17161_t:CDS:10, partial [Cetraspora pellucida]